MLLWTPSTIENTSKAFMNQHHLSCSLVACFMYINVTPVQAYILNQINISIWAKLHLLIVRHRMHRVSEFLKIVVFVFMKSVKKENFTFLPVSSFWSGSSSKCNQLPLPISHYPTEQQNPFEIALLFTWYILRNIVLPALVFYNFYKVTNIDY